MKLIPLGTGGFHPSESRHTASFLLPAEGILFDAGTSVFRAKERLQTDHLDILVSHAHLDHIVGLTHLIELRETVSQMTAYMSSETATAVREHLFAEAIFPVDPPFDIVEITPGDDYELRSGGAMQCFPLVHPGGCLGFRINWPNRSIAYVTDTTAAVDAEYVEQIEGVSLLIHECYFPDGMEELAARTGHSCATPVAEVAAAANVDRMLVVHVSPTETASDPIGMKVIQEIFPAAMIARDLLEVEF